MNLNNKSSKLNNFDLIRLLAALQVLFYHGLAHLKIIYSPLFEPIIYFFRFFPGVPVFFSISGYLIYGSFKRNHNDIKLYFRNRFLRLYPGLWMCFLITLILLFLFKVISFPDFIKNPLLDIWVLCQLTVFQFYTPDMLRGWGVGNPNGSLWTLSVEIQFYILLPLIFFLISKVGKFKWLIFVLLISISLITAAIFNHFDSHSIKYKLSEVFILPYLWNFLLGILFAEYWGEVKKFVQGKFLLWVGIYILWILIFGFYYKDYIPSYWPGNVQSLVGLIILSIVTFSAAYSNTGLSLNLLKGNDISYGIYIYHMVVINTLVTLKYLYNPLNLCYAFLITLILSYLSWIFIERKFLKLKHPSIYETNRPEY